MAILLGSVIFGTKNIQSSMSYMEKTAASLIGSGIAYIASNIAGAPDSFKNSLLMTGLTLPLPWIGKHIKADETVIKMSELIPTSVYLANVWKHIRDTCPGFKTKRKMNDALHSVLQKSAGLLTAIMVEQVGVVLYGFAKAYFTQSCA